LSGRKSNSRVSQSSCAEPTSPGAVSGTSSESSRNQFARSLAKTVAYRCNRELCFVTSRGNACQKFSRSPEQVRAYLSCVMLLLLKLELTRHHAQRPDVLLPTKINYKE
jgi:hypothetical protein